MSTFYFSMLACVFNSICKSMFYLSVFHSFGLFVRLNLHTPSHRSSTSPRRHLDSSVFPTMFDKTPGKIDMLVARGSTIVMCHLISNHTVLIQKREEGRRAKIGWYGKYRGRMEIGEGEEREEVGGCRGKEISVSAKVFIKILRQMISVSFS